MDKVEKPVLLIHEGEKAGQRWTLQSDLTVVGRGNECDLLLPERQISRQHIRIRRSGGQYIIEDIDSKNGTWVNGRKLLGTETETEIREGDRIQVGKMIFRLAINTVADVFECLEPDRLSGFLPDAASRLKDEEIPEPTEEFLNLGGLGEEVGIKSEVIEETLVVTPLRTELDEENEVDAFRDALVSLSQQRLPNRVVINLTHVGHLSGRAIGVLVAHHLRLSRSGGALRVCLANPRVAVVLEQVKLGMLVDYHPTVEDAVISNWRKPTDATRRN